MILPELKVKLISLGLEAAAIKRIEAKLKRQQSNANAKNRFDDASGHLVDRMSLQRHRKGSVRHEARHSLLAHGFLTGKHYNQIEQWHRPGNKPDLAKLHKMVVRFGGAVNRGEMDDWYIAPPEVNPFLPDKTERVEKPVHPRHIAERQKAQERATKTAAV